MAGARNNKQKMTTKQRFAALFRVAKISYKAAPSVLYIRGVGAVLDSVLPIVTTYFAARTTTELARAYNGEAGAGEAAIMFVLLTALLGVVTTAWSTVSEYFERSARYKLESAVGDRLMQQFLSLDYWRYDDKETADLLDKSRQFSYFFASMFNTVASIVTALVALVASVIALLFVSWWLSLLLLVAVVPGVLIQYRLSKARVEHWEENIDARRKASYLQWQLTQLHSIAEIRLYGLVQHLIALYRGYRNQDEQEQIHLERSFLKKEFLASVLEAAAEVAALLYVTLQIIAQALPIGQFLYVQQIVSRGLGSMRTVTQSFINIDESLANLSAYDMFMGLPVQKRGKQKALDAPKHIALRDVTFQYPKSESVVLDSVSIEIKQGEHVAVVGENGAGKSTLIKLLLGFYEPTKGAVLVDGVDMKQLDLEHWHGRLGVLQQFSTDFEYAVAKDNITFGDVSRPFSNKRYIAAIERAEAKEFLDKLPKKDESYITKWMEHEDGTAGVSLSGGQRQRLALARNLYRDSPVVILDEPTSAIDALAESRIFKRLFEEKDKTIITVSHRLSTVRRADRIYVMDEGKVVETGTHAELVKKKGTYFTLFESQL